MTAGSLRLRRFPGVRNISDVGTKALEREKHAYLMKQMGMRKMSEDAAVNQLVNLERGGMATGSIGQHGALLGALALLFHALGARADNDMVVKTTSLGGDIQGMNNFWYLILAAFLG